MAETKWTPGPWMISTEIEDGIPDHWIHAVGPMKWDHFARVHGNEDDELNAQGAANARLVAAAPDLYEACAAMERFLSVSMPPPAWAKALTIVHAALAKARGEG